eukprot:1631865-Pleurochrysis_carterae.AAC.3
MSQDVTPASEVQMIPRFSFHVATFCFLTLSSRTTSKVAQKFGKKQLRSDASRSKMRLKLAKL